jgi:hypothetical protein
MSLLPGERSEAAGGAERAARDGGECVTQKSPRLAASRRSTSPHLLRKWGRKASTQVLPNLDVMEQVGLHNRWAYWK